jgi:hypothetical protein
MGEVFEYDLYSSRTKIYVDDELKVYDNSRMDPKNTSMENLGYMECFLTNGTVYVYAGGDGIDSNSRASYSAIAFNGGNTVIISTSGGNSAIDSDGGYKYTGGRVLAIMPSGGMSGESTHCSNFSSIGKKQSVSLSASAYATVKIDGSAVLSVKMPKALNSALAIYLGNKNAAISSATSSAGTADSNGVYWVN